MMTTRRHDSASRRPFGGRQSRVVALIALAGLALTTLALAGCQTVTGSPTTEAEDNLLAASPANIASLTGVVQSNPTDPQAYNMRGSVFGQAGRNDEALTDFNKAVSLDPNYAQAYGNRGLIYRKTGKLDLALADYNKAFAILPVNSESYFYLFVLYQCQKQHHYAIDDFTTAIGLTQNQAEPYIARGLSSMAVNDLKAAAAALDDAVSAEPQNLQAWTTRAFAYEKLGDKEKAAGSYARALNIKQDHEPAKQGFARVGGKMGQTYQ